MAISARQVQTQQKYVSAFSLEGFIHGPLVIVPHQKRDDLIDIIAGDNRVTLYRSQAENAAHFGGFFSIPYNSTAPEENVVIGLNYVPPEEVEAQLKEKPGFGSEFDPTWVRLADLEAELENPYASHPLDSTAKLRGTARFEGLQSLSNFKLPVYYDDFNLLTRLIGIMYHDKHVPVFEVQLNSAQLTPWLDRSPK